MSLSSKTGSVPLSSGVVQTQNIKQVHKGMQSALVTSSTVGAGGAFGASISAPPFLP